MCSFSVGFRSSPGQNVDDQVLLRLLGIFTRGQINAVNHLLHLSRFFSTKSPSLMLT